MAQSRPSSRGAYSRTQAASQHNHQNHHPQHASPHQHANYHPQRPHPHHPQASGQMVQQQQQSLAPAMLESYEQHAPSTPSAAADGNASNPFVSVAIRVRPSFSEEPVAVWAKENQEPEEVGPMRRLCCHRGYVLEEYEFSRVFSPEDDNARVFAELQGPRLADSVLSGVNETLFAYGQTGSGKTHTIFGSKEEVGLLLLFVRELFDRVSHAPGSTVHVCCYEVLGDSLTDLVDAESFLAQGTLRPEDVVCDELFIKTQKCRYQIVRVNTLETCMRLLQSARLNRTTGVSSYNQNSSRSHAVVHIFVQNPVANQMTQNSSAGSENGSNVVTGAGLNSTIGALTLVDLAGTEKEHENPSEQGRKSARLLNTSLSSLNRMLRKLQTGTLDESERRQSVLNKCLWEYMRPGCGIGLIFCVNPLLRHRTTTLSTLSMAMDSTLISNQRKAQFVQLPDPKMQPPELRAPTPRQGRRASTPGDIRSDIRDIPEPGHSTPQGGCGLPVRRRSCPNCAAMFEPNCATPGSARTLESPAISSFSGDQLPWGVSPEMHMPEYHDGCGSHEHPWHGQQNRFVGPDAWSALHSLEWQNSKLREKLNKMRAKSQERLLRAETETEQLSAENAALERECRSLRALFIQQQQQQIAFWTGPFMDMLAPKERGLNVPALAAIGMQNLESASDLSRLSAVKSAALAAVGLSGFPPPDVTIPTGSGGASASSCKAADATSSMASTTTTACGSKNQGTSSSGNATPIASRWEDFADDRQVPTSSTLSGSAVSSRGCGASHSTARRECLQALRQERDYWRQMAANLKREVDLDENRSSKVGDQVSMPERSSDDMSCSPASLCHKRDTDAASSEGTGVGASALAGCCSSSSSSTTSLPGCSASVSSAIGTHRAGEGRSTPGTPTEDPGMALDYVLQGHSQFQPLPRNDSIPRSYAGPAMQGLDNSRSNAMFARVPASKAPTKRRPSTSSSSCSRGPFARA